MTNTHCTGLLADSISHEPRNMIILALLTVVGIVGLLMLLFFLRVISLWMRAYLAGGRISPVAIIAMMFRRTSPANVVRFRIMAVQAGLDVRTPQIESAILQGIDVETALLAMIHARATGKEVTWHEATADDVKERLRKKLFD